MVKNELQPYHAVKGLTAEQYAKLFEIKGLSKEKSKELGERAVKMGGVFWSKRYEKIYFGKFELCRFISFSEFKVRLNLTLKTLENA